MTLQGLLLSTLICLLSWAVASSVGQHEGYTRVVLSVPHEVIPQVTKKNQHLIVLLPGVKLPSESTTVLTQEIHGQQITSTQKGTVWKLTLKHPEVTVLRMFQLKNPPRLVLDVGRKTVNPPAAAKRRLKVVIDAGHGGMDPGMVGYVTEKEVTLDVALKLRDVLRKHGVEVALTRDRDVQLAADKRTDLQARAQLANSGTVNVFISIHVNSGPAGAQGVETFIFGEPQGKATQVLAVQENGGGAVGEAITKQATGAAQSILGDILMQANLTLSHKLALRVQQGLMEDLQVVNRGVKTGPLMVLRYARTPALLVEIGFGTHPVEGRKLDNPAYRQQVSGAIAQGVLSFLHVP